MNYVTHHALGLLAGVGLIASTLAAEEPAARAKAPAYYVTQIELTGDANGFVKNYGSEVAETVAPFGGRFVVRGAQALHLEGDPVRSRTAVIQFDSMEQAQAWYYSFAYQMLIPIRQQYAQTNSYLVEGVAP